MPLVWDKFDYPITNPSSAEELIQEFSDREARNEAKPLKKDYTLSIRQYYTHCFLEDAVYDLKPLLHGLPSSDNRMAVSAEAGVHGTRFQAQRTRLTEFDSISLHEIKLILSKPLHNVYAARHAQVWTARTPRGNTVAVKKFQACFTDTPYWVPSRNPLDGDDAGRLDDFAPEEEQAHREAWAYHSLRSLQGSLLPYSYGFYEVSDYQYVYAHIQVSEYGRSSSRLVI